MFLWALRHALKGRARMRSSSPLRTVFVRISSRPLITVPVRGGTGVSRRTASSYRGKSSTKVSSEAPLRILVVSKRSDILIFLKILVTAAPVLRRQCCCWRATLPQRPCLCCFSWPRDQDKGIVTLGDHAGLQNISRERCSLERRFVSSLASGEDCGDYLGVEMFSLLTAPHRETVTLSTACHCASERQRRHVDSP